MAYQVEDLTRLKHLLEFGERFLEITDAHDERITAIENGSGGSTGIYYGTKAEWAEKGTLIPAAGAIIIYSDYATEETIDGVKNIPNFKVGDGNAYLVDLPFSQDDIRDALTAHISDNLRHLTQDDRDKLANSVAVSVEQNADGDYTLVFTK